MGPCIGVGSYSPALTDFIIQVQNTSQMFITGPAVIKEVLGETVTMEELGGAKIHSEVSGVTDLVAKNDEECLATIRRLHRLFALELRVLATAQRQPAMIRRARSISWKPSSRRT